MIPADLPLWMQVNIYMEAAVECQLKGYNQEIVKNLINLAWQKSNLIADVLEKERTLRLLKQNVIIIKNTSSLSLPIISNVKDEVDKVLNSLTELIPNMKTKLVHAAEWMNPFKTFNLTPLKIFGKKTGPRQQMRIIQKVLNSVRLDGADVDDAIQMMERERVLLDNTQRLLKTSTDLNATLTADKALLREGGKINTDALELSIAHMKGHMDELQVKLVEEQEKCDALEREYIEKMRNLEQWGFDNYNFAVEQEEGQMAASNKSQILNSMVDLAIQEIAKTEAQLASKETELSELKTANPTAVDNAPLEKRINELTGELGTQKTNLTSLIEEEKQKLVNASEELAQTKASLQTAQNNAVTAAGLINEMKLAKEGLESESSTAAKEHLAAIAGLNEQLQALTTGQATTLQALENTHTLALKAKEEAVKDELTQLRNEKGLSDTKKAALDAIIAENGTIMTQLSNDNKELEKTRIALQGELDAAKKLINGQVGGEAIPLAEPVIPLAESVEVAPVVDVTPPTVDAGSTIVPTPKLELYFQDQSNRGTYYLKIGDELWNEIGKRRELNGNSVDEEYTDLIKFKQKQLQIPLVQEVISAIQAKYAEEKTPVPNLTIVPRQVDRPDSSATPSVASDGGITPYRMYKSLKQHITDGTITDVKFIERFQNEVDQNITDGRNLTNESKTKIRAFYNESQGSANLSL